MDKKSKVQNIYYIERLKYIERIMKTCENCGTEHNGTYGSGRFCSSKCARGFSTKAKREEINEKVSNTLTGSGHGSVKLMCTNCECEFEVNWNKRHQITCSSKCAKESNWQNEGYKSKMSKINSKKAFERHAVGDKSFGWKTRHKLQPSYPESIAIALLNSLHIEYEYEMPLDKYYVDFAMHERMIAIEIDGIQHEKPERIKTDKIKDDLLKERGWTVYRIKWPKDNIIESIKYILKH